MDNNEENQKIIKQIEEEFEKFKQEMASLRSRQNELLSEYRKKIDEIKMQTLKSQIYEK